MKTLALFGGSGGLGSQLKKPLEKNYDVISLSSKDVDITSSSELELFFDKNNIDIIVNSSGYNYNSFLHKIDDWEEVDKMIDVNVLGNIKLLNKSLPKMRDNGYGRVILISSVLSKKVVQGTCLYSGSKSFIDSLVRTVSAENISKGITCNSIRLGYFDGGMCHRLPEKFKSSIKKSIGLRRWGSINELYNTIEYLINTEYITGQNIEISGG